MIGQNPRGVFDVVHRIEGLFRIYVDGILLLVVGIASRSSTVKDQYALATLRNSPWVIETEAPAAFFAVNEKVPEILFAVVS